MGWRRKTLDLFVLACFAGLVAIVVGLAVTAGGPKLGLVDGHFALETLTLRWGLVLTAAVLALSAIAGMLMVLEYRSNREWPSGVWVVAITLAVSLPTLAWVGAAAATYAAAPPVAEVTTDIETPPQFTQALVLRRGVEANPVLAAGQHLPDHRLEPVFLNAPPEEVFDAIIDIARAQRWRVGTTAASRGMIELTVESFWYARTDDFVIRITADGDRGSRVDYRACARTGKRDGGRNARRLDRLERLLNARFG